MKKQNFMIVGGGLSGALLAILIARRGYKVSLYEKRPDMRLIAQNVGRSINLALSVRGIRGLELAGLEHKVMAQAIAMKGRMIHLENNSLSYQPYSTRPNEYINSVSRYDLNVILLNEAAKLPEISIFFDHECHAFDYQTNTATFLNHARLTSSASADYVIGTDGAGSAIRTSYEKRPDFQLEIEPLGYGYKELTIYPNEQQEFRMEPNALHIWPRGSFMLIALPNPDKTFTCTLFLSERGNNSFENLTERLDVISFFENNFQDALEQMPHLAEEFLINPVGKLATVRCSPWHYEGRSLILGDAAHAVVPFFGQGMNCSFEDCTIFDQLATTYQEDWKTVFKRFSDSRKIDADAIAQLAVDNFIEMRDHTADPVFIRKRKAEIRLEEQFGLCFESKYTMVSFRHIPYSQALEIGTQQDNLLMQLCSNINSIDDLDFDKIIEALT